MAGVELATGYVTLTVEASDVSRQIGRAFKQAEGMASTTGSVMGKALTQGMAKANTNSLDRISDKLEDAKDKADQLAKKYEQTSERMSQAATKSAREQENAARQVEIAQTKLNEALEKGANQSTILSAEDRLARARQKLSDVTDKAKATQEVYASSLKDLGSKLEAAKLDVGKLTHEFDQVSAAAKDSAGDVERAGGRFSNAFSGLKGKIKSTINGAFDPIRDEAKGVFRKTEDDADDAGQRVGNSFKDSLKGTLVGLGAYVGIQEVGQGLWSSLLSAGDLEQSSGAVDSVFKDYSWQMHNFARTASDTVGLSANEFNELSTSLGSLLKNGGVPLDQLGDKTSSLIQLGSDLASMYGGSTAEAVSAIGSALKGEMDPIERYGISLSDATLTQLGLTMGIEKTGGAFTDQQKKLLVQEALFRQSADAQGNFARESETFSHKLEVAKAKVGDLSAKIGQLLLPAMTTTFGWLGDVALPALEEFAGGVQAFIGAWVSGGDDITSSGFAGSMEELAHTMRNGYDTMKEWMPVWLPFASGVAAVTGTFVAYKAVLQAVSMYQGIATAVTTAWQIVTGVQTGTLWGLTAAQWAAITPIALTVGALVALGVAIKMAYENVGWFRDMVDTAWAWVKGVISGVVDWFRDTAVPAFKTAISAVGDWFSGLYTDYIAPAWDWVKSTIYSVVDWFQNVASPAIGEALRVMGEWFARANSEYVQPAMQAVRDIFGGVVSWIQDAVGWLGDAFTWLYQNVIHPVWYGVMATVTMVAAILLTIFQGIAWAVTTLLGPVFTWLYDNVIKPVWSWIQGAIQGFVSWWSDVAVPAIGAAVSIVGALWDQYKDQVLQVWNFVQGAVQGFISWWSGVAVPAIQTVISVVVSAWQWLSDRVGEVWSWISNKISATWNWIQYSILVPAKVFLDNVLVPTFLFLWDQVSKVWSWISDKISFTWNWVQGNVLTPLVTFLRDTVGAAFRTLWDTVSQVWGWISDKISGTWDWLKNSVLKPLGDYITTTFVGFFEAAKDGIGRAWDMLKDLVREPVRFVIDTVINDGVIKNYNKLNDFWGGDDLDEMKFPAGFRKGGFTGNYGLNEVAGVVHGREFVTRAEATDRVNREHPGFLETLNRTGSVTQSLGVSAGPAHGSHCAHCSGAAAMGAAVSHSTSASTAGAPPSGGNGGIWGAFQQSIASAGKLYVPKMNFMGVNTENVARAWIGRSAVEIIPGSGNGPSISFAQGGAGTWGFNAGSQIWMQLGVPQGMREAVLIHELGHALSLHHTMNTGSIMHPLMQGPTWPSALDYGSLVNAWGAPGGGVKTYDGGGGGVFGFLASKAEEMITNKVHELADAARDHFLPNKFVHMPIGIAEKSAVDVVKKAASFFGGGSYSPSAAMGVAPALYDNGGLIHRGVQIIDHQRSTPDYVLTQDQWRGMLDLANHVSETQPGRSPEVQLNVGTMVGADADELADKLQTRLRRTAALY